MNRDEKEILKWLGGDHGVGSSSKAIALTALGMMPSQPSYPHDPDDFGRCRRLLAKVPYAKRGLAKLAKDGGPVWKALVAHWDEIDAQFEESERNCWNEKPEGKCYHLMRSIIDPASKTAFPIGIRD